MNFQAILNKRRTVRFFQQKNVAKSHLDAMLEAARLAPSAANNQLLRYTVVSNLDLAQAIFYHTSYGGRVKPRRSPQWGVNAPRCFIAVSAVKPSSGALSSHVYADAGAALMAMSFAAVDEKLGCCWIGSFQATKVADLLALPANEQLLYLLAVGHPAETPVAVDLPQNGNVAYYLDEYDVLHVPKYTAEAITRFWE